MLFYLSKPSETQLCATRVKGFMKNMYGRDKALEPKTYLTTLVLSEPVQQGKLVLRNWPELAERGREKETKWIPFIEVARKTQACVRDCSWLCGCSPVLSRDGELLGPHVVITFVKFFFIFREKRSRVSENAIFPPLDKISYSFMPKILTNSNHKTEVRLKTLLQAVCFRLV